MATRYLTTPGGTNLLTSLGGTLSDGDTVYVNTGNDTLTDGLNQAAKTFPLFALVGKFEGSIGDGTSVLECDIGTLLLQCNARALYFKAGSTTSTVALAKLRPTRTNCLISFTSGTLTECQMAGGSLIIADVADINILRQTGGSSILRAGAQKINTLDLQGGTCQCDRDLGDANVAAGMLIVGDSSVTPDSINVASGATLDYSGGNIATLTSERGATIDMMKLTKPITITDHYCTEGAVIKSAPGMVTVTNEHPYGNAPRFGV